MGMEAVARPVNVDGTSTYHGYLFARKDSGIRTVADMKGKRFAYVDRATTAGYLFPRAYLKEKGVADPDRYFGEVFFAGSHDATVLAVLNGEADIGASKTRSTTNWPGKTPASSRNSSSWRRPPSFPRTDLPYERTWTRNSRRR